MNEKFCIFIRISLKFVPKGPTDYNSALVQVMTWRRTGDKLLPEPMLAEFTYTYVALWGDELTDFLKSFIGYQRFMITFMIPCWHYSKWLIRSCNMFKRLKSLYTEKDNLHIETGSWAHLLSVVEQCLSHWQCCQVGAWCFWEIRKFNPLHAKFSEGT